MIDFQWTNAEKKIARRAFETAYDRECEAIKAELQKRASHAVGLNDIWAVEEFLSKRRRAIDEKYDYRYSQLIILFARLVHEKWLEAKDLEGLAQDKLDRIMDIANWQAP